MLGDCLVIVMESMRVCVPGDCLGEGSMWVCVCLVAGLEERRMCVSNDFCLVNVLGGEAGVCPMAA